MGAVSSDLIVTYRMSGPIVSEVFKQAAEAGVFNKEPRS